MARCVPSHPRRYFNVSKALCSQNGSGSETLLFPEVASSAKHHDLASFLQYTEQSGLAKTSTTYIGTHYEYTVLDSLSEYGFKLQRVGGASDYGIDLLGTWPVPSASQPLKVLLQCKALSQKTGPHLIRELEGAFAGAPIGWRSPGVVGLLVTEKPATQGIRDALGRSQLPMGFISCSRVGLVLQMLWNGPAQDQGLEGLQVRLEHRRAGPGATSKLFLDYKGRRYPPNSNAQAPASDDGQ